jgi:hypothetical protein
MPAPTTMKSYAEAIVPSLWPGGHRPLLQNRIFYVYDLSTADLLARDDKPREIEYAVVSAT